MGPSEAMAGDGVAGDVNQPLDKFALLAGVHLFSRCEPMELAVLARRSDVRTFVAGTELCRAGAVGTGLHVIADGRVEINGPGDAHQEIGAGESVGALTLVTDVPHLVTASSLTEVTLLELGVGPFRKLIRELPNLAMHVMSVLGEDVVAQRQCAVH